MSHHLPSLLDLKDTHVRFFGETLALLHSSSSPAVSLIVAGFSCLYQLHTSGKSLMHRLMYYFNEKEKFPVLIVLE